MMAMELTLTIMAILALGLCAEPLFRRLMAAVAWLERKPVLPENPIQTRQDMQALASALFVLLGLIVAYWFVRWGGN